MTQYSHSKLSTFEQCQYKYKLKYIDKIKPEFEKSIEAHLGTCVHDTLEWIYKEVLASSIPTLDDAIIHYTEKWTTEDADEFVIVKKDLTAKDYFEKGINFVIDYYVAHQPFDEGTLELEKQVMIKLGEHYIVGYIDRISENKETKEIEIHDYKTANTLPSKEKIETDRQLALYSIAIKEIFGQNRKVKLIWHFLAHKTKITSTRTDEQLEQLKREILELIKTIEETEDFPKCKSMLCNWCEYKVICEGPREKQVKLENYPTASKYIKD